MSLMINSQGITYVPKDEPHVRWNWEQSPEDPLQVRYHFVIAGYKDNKAILISLEGELAKAGHTVDEKRKAKIPRGLLVTLDTYSGPFLIDWTKIPGRNYHDRRLYERIKKGTSIERYVESVYS